MQSALDTKEKLSLIRLKAKMTQEALAETGVASKTAISNAETGASKPKMETIEKWAKECGLPLDEFFRSKVPSKYSDHDNLDIFEVLAELLDSDRAERVERNIRDLYTAYRVSLEEEISNTAGRKRSSKKARRKSTPSRQRKAANE